MTEKVICPICKSEAEAINAGLFDGVGIRCKTHGEFEVADSALAMHKDTESTRWEGALRSAKDRAKAAQETSPRITCSDVLPKISKQDLAVTTGVDVVFTLADGLPMFSGPSTTLAL
jgi:hypothetical protein